MPLATLPSQYSRGLRLLGLGVLLAVILFPLVFDLHRVPIQFWDESRLAVNAQEMHDSGNLLVTTFDRQPDLWNTKPPLLIWLQAAMISMLGSTELAIRIPTAAAAIATVLLLIGFSAHGLSTLGGGLAAGFVLVTLPGYVALHMARTGDYDSFLVWWLTLGLVSFFQYLETNRPRYLIVWGIALAAAVMTKGVAALLGSPALVLYVLLQGKLLPLLRQPRFWLVLLASLALPALYYMAREAAAPGYWHAVSENELGGRFATAIEEHTGPWYIYLGNLQDHLLGFWTYWTIPAALVLVLEPKSATRRFALLLVLFIVCWMAVISSAQTKLEWYPGPIYPLTAWLLGLALVAVYRRCQQWLPASTRTWQPLAGMAALLVLMIMPYKAIIDSIIDQRTNDASWGESTAPLSFLRQYLREHPDYRQVALVYPGGYHPMLMFYAEAFRNKGIELRLALPADVSTFPDGTEVIVSSPELRDKLLASYQATLLYEEGPCAAYLLQSRK